MNKWIGHHDGDKAWIMEDVPNGKNICVMEKHVTMDNLRLLAAAPTMLADLRLIVAGWGAQAKAGDPLTPWELERYNYAIQLIASVG